MGRNVGERKRSGEEIKMKNRKERERLMDYDIFATVDW